MQITHTTPRREVLVPSSIVQTYSDHSVTEALGTILISDYL